MLEGRDDFCRVRGRTVGVDEGSLPPAALSGLEEAVGEEERKDGRFFLKVVWGGAESGVSSSIGVRELIEGRKMLRLLRRRLDILPMRRSSCSCSELRRKLTKSCLPALTPSAVMISESTGPW